SILIGARAFASSMPFSHMPERGSVLVERESLSGISSLRRRPQSFRTNSKTLTAQHWSSCAVRKATVQSGSRRCCHHQCIAGQVRRLGTWLRDIENLLNDVRWDV